MPTSNKADAIWTRGAVLLFLGCFLYSLYVRGIGWNNRIVDLHDFRQTQTAITAYFMIGRPPTLAYETPVMGPPWTVPFEFPVFQWTVAGIVTWLGTPLDQTGRFVNIFYFTLALIPAYYLLGVFKLSTSERLVALSLLLVSPFYLFWSRTFLIESTALFFGLAYLAAAVWSWRSGRPAVIALALVCGALAATTKVTTFAVCLLAWLLYLASHWREGAAIGPQPRMARLILAALSVAAPAIAAFAWTRFTDELKEQNPLSRYMTSRALWEWNFSTWRQRREAQTWAWIGHWGCLGVGSKWVWGGALASVVLAPRRWRQILACSVLFLTGPLIFTNVYYRHEYYSFANNHFLIALVALALAALWEKNFLKPLAAVGLFAVIGLNVWSYFTNYYDIQAANRLPDLVRFCKDVQQRTAPSDVLVFIGLDWDSKYAYYSRRRALMLHNSIPAEEMAGCLSRLKDEHVGMLFLNRESRFAENRKAIQEFLKRANLNPEPSRLYAEKVEVYLPRGQSGDLLAR